MVPLKKKRFRDTPAFGNTLALVGMVVVISVLGVMMPKAEAEQQVVALELPATLVTPEQVDCMPVYYAAEMIMQYRQDGLPLNVMITMFDDKPEIVKVVKESFTVSQFSLRKNQDRAAKEFAEKQYNKCESVNL